MIAPSPQLSLTIAQDRGLISGKGKSVRYIVADLAALGHPGHTKEPAPLHLALAIDVSGSMEGDRIMAARDTAAKLVESLTPRHRLTLVTFSDDAELLLSARPMDMAGRAVAQSILSELRIQASTNLHAGWDLAVRQLLEAQRVEARGAHRVLLLTDGHANEGLTAVPELTRLCAEAQQLGITTSAVGIGDGYGEVLLAAMAEAGGGRLHDATNAAEISDVVIGELLEGREALLEGAALVIEHANVLRCEVVGAWGVRTIGHQTTVLVGRLLADAPKRVVLRLFCPVGNVGDSVGVTISGGAQIPDQSAVIQIPPTVVGFTFAEGEAVRTQKRSAETFTAVLAAWQSHTMRQALARNADGDTAGAARLVERTIRRMRFFAEGLPALQGIVAQLEEFGRRISRELESRERKVMYLEQTQMLRGERDLRMRPARPARPRRRP